MWLSSPGATGGSRPASSTRPSAVAATEHHLSARIERLEATVNAHDDLIQQLRGARNLLTLIFGASVLTAVLGVLTLLGHVG